MEYLCEASVAGPHRKVHATGFWGKELSSSLTSANYSHLLFEMFWGPWSKIKLTCMISARWRPTKSQNPSEQYTVQCAWKLITPPISHFQTICLALKVHLLDNLEGLKHFPGQNLNLQGIFGQNSVHFNSYLDCLKSIKLQKAFCELCGNCWWDWRGVSRRCLWNPIFDHDYYHNIISLSLISLRFGRVPRKRFEILSKKLFCGRSNPAPARPSASGILSEILFLIIIIRSYRSHWYH